MRNEDGENFAVIMSGFHGWDTAFRVYGEMVGWVVIGWGSFWGFLICRWLVLWLGYKKK